MTIDPNRDSLVPYPFASGYQRRLSQSPPDKKIQMQQSKIYDRLLCPVDFDNYNIDRMMRKRRLFEGNELLLQNPYEKLRVGVLLNTKNPTKRTRTAKRRESVPLPFAMHHNRENCCGPAMQNNLPGMTIDAPTVADNFYVNPLHWASDGTCLVALGNVLWFLFIDVERNNSRATRIYQTQANISAVKQWSYKDNMVMGVSGTSYFFLTPGIEHPELYELRPETENPDHYLSAIATHGHSEFVLGGMYSSSFLPFFDLRVSQKKPQSRFHTGENEPIEIASLLWDERNPMTLVAGENNSCLLWDIRKPEKCFKNYSVNNQAGVKAVAWHPGCTSILFMGGGLSDRTIRIIDTNVFEEEEAARAVISTNGAVSQMIISNDGKSLWSSPGYAEEGLDPLPSIVWTITDDLTSLIPKRELIGHSDRVLVAEASPDQRYVATLGADARLMIWNGFSSSSKKHSKNRDIPALLPDFPPKVR